MSWEYLKTKPFEIRYKITAEQLPDLSDKIVVDINCGEPLFKNYIKYKKYYANDIYQPDDVSGIEFIKCTDTEVDVKPDVLCVFGYGGGEYTGEPLESKTTGKTIERLAKYHPEYIVIEMAQKWEEDFKALTNIKLPDYKMVFQEKINLGEHYHDQRLLTIYQYAI